MVYGDSALKAKDIYNLFFDYERIYVGPTRVDGVEFVKRDSDMLDGIFATL